MTDDLEFETYQRKPGERMVIMYDDPSILARDKDWIRYWNDLVKIKKDDIDDMIPPIEWQMDRCDKELTRREVAHDEKGA